MDRKKIIGIALAAALIGIGIGYVVGSKGGYTKGYGQAEADIKKLEEQSAKKASEDAAKAANPFQAVNPLEGVEANPFEKAKKVLNPFE